MFLVQQFIKLATEEAAAINCHMGFSDSSPSVVRNIGNAYSQFPLALITMWLMRLQRSCSIGDAVTLEPGRKHSARIPEHTPQRRRKQAMVCYCVKPLLQFNFRYRGQIIKSKANATDVTFHSHLIV